MLLFWFGGLLQRVIDAARAFGIDADGNDFPAVFAASSNADVTTPGLTDRQLARRLTQLLMEFCAAHCDAFCLPSTRRR